MLLYSERPTNIIKHHNQEIYSFVSDLDKNIDLKTVRSFSDEWLHFNRFDTSDIELIGNEYFDVIQNPLHIHKDSIVLDVGCGSGRWSKFISSKVKFVEAIDPGDSVFAAHEYVKNTPNIRVTQAGVDNIPFEDHSFDFVFSLGVLHHIPNTLNAMKNCVKKLKNGGYFLVYLYYKLDNRGYKYKYLFYAMDLLRKIISKFPKNLKKIFCDLIATFIYWPLAKGSSLLYYLGFQKLAHKIPLSYYRDKSFYIMRNDALDRFGTPLESRFTKKEIEDMMKQCGLTEIVFSEKPPYWHAIGKKTIDVL